MTIGLIATVSIRPDGTDEFEKLFAWQAEQVRANEAGNSLYKLFKSREAPGKYVVMEIYDDEAALQAHRDSEHMKANRPKVAPLVAEPTVIELFDAA